MCVQWVSLPVALFTLLVPLQLAHVSLRADLVNDSKDILTDMPPALAAFSIGVGLTRSFELTGGTGRSAAEHVPLGTDARANNVHMLAPLDARSSHPADGQKVEKKALNLHVLVADDSAQIRRQVEMFLGKLGCTCRWVTMMSLFVCDIIIVILYRSSGLSQTVIAFRPSFHQRCALLTSYCSTST